MANWMKLIRSGGFQLRLGSDETNYTDFTTGAGGDLTIAPTGGDTTITGNARVNGIALHNTGVVTSAAAGDVVIALGNEVRGVSYAGTDTVYLIGNSGTSSNEILVGESSANTNLLSGAVFFNNIATTASAANAFLDGAASNKILRSTSSVRYKDVLREMDVAEARAVVSGSDPMVYRSLADADADREFVGMTAECIAEIDPRFIHYDEDGRPDGLMYDRFVVPLTVVARDHESRIAALEARLT